MKILWLKSDLLLPLDKGGKLRTWHLLRHLARRHDITYVAFAERDQLDERGSVRKTLAHGMREVCARLVTVPRADVRKGTWRFYADAAAHIFDRLPYAVGKYRSRRYRRAVSRLLDEHAFDVVVCDFLVPAVNLPKRLPCPAVIFTHNVEADIWRRHAETHGGRVTRFLYALQYRRMLRFERSTLRRFDRVLTVSDADAQTFESLYPGALRRPATIVPTGVDTDFFSPASPGDKEAPHLVFTGSMDWLPNEDAMLFFCRDILPAIRAQEPGVSVSIVGREPTPAVRRLADQDAVEVTGRVDDVRPYMRRAAVYVVPLRIGGGTRLKIFEAMAMGKAVVSTTVGAEGLPIVPDEHALIADEPEAFARSVVELLRDVPRRRRLERAARARVVERFDWSAVAGDLEDALVETESQRRPAAAPRTLTTPVTG